jgi:RNA-directed DNA polymerase
LTQLGLASSIRYIQRLGSLDHIRDCKSTEVIGALPPSFSGSQMARISDSLTAFPQTAGFDLDTLKSRLRVLEWDVPGVPKTAYQVLVTIWQSAFDVAQKLARKHRVPVVTVIRNLVAESCEADLRAYHYWLSFLANRELVTDTVLLNVANDLVGSTVPPEEDMIQALVGRKRISKKIRNTFTVENADPKSGIKIDRSLKALAAHDFSDGALMEWLVQRVHLSTSLQDRVLDALRDHSGALEKEAPADPALLRKIDRLPCIPARALLSFWARPIHKRGDYVLRTSSENRAHLLALLAPTDWSHVLVVTPFKRLCNLLRILPEETKEGALSGCVDFFDRQDVHPYLVKVCVLASDETHLVAHLDGVVKQVVWCQWDSALCQKWAQVLKCLLFGKKSYGPRLARAMSANILGHLGDGQRKIVRRALLKLRAELPDLYKESFLALVREQSQVVNDVFTEKEIQEDVSTFYRSSDVPPGFLALKGYPQRAWIGFLKSFKHEIPQGLVHTLNSASDGVLLEAALIRPDVFAAQAIVRLPLERMLVEAFKLPELASEVSLRTTTAQRLALVEFVRERWHKHPSIAAAYEVALTYSLVDARYLKWLAFDLKRKDSRPGHRFDHLYRTYRLPKKSGGHRVITVPEDPLKRLQRRMLDAGLSAMPLSPAVTGFRTGVSIVENARPHVGKDMVVNVDIDAFFPSTGYEQILKVCQRLPGLSIPAAKLVADICSYQGALPTGAPTSPSIANLVLGRFDRALLTASKKYDITYTRYADDLTFSGNGDTHKIIPFAQKLLKEYGYVLSAKKTNIFRKGRRQVVTGLVVNETVNLPRRLRRRLRAAIHHRVTGRTPHWHEREMHDAELLGRLAFLNQITPGKADKLRMRLNPGV